MDWPNGRPIRGRAVAARKLRNGMPRSSLQTSPVQNGRQGRRREAQHRPAVRWTGVRAIGTDRAAGQSRQSRGGRRVRRRGKQWAAPVAAASQRPNRSRARWWRRYRSNRRCRACFAQAPARRHFRVHSRPHLARCGRCRGHARDRRRERTAPRARTAPADRLISCSFETGASRQLRLHAVVPAAAASL